MERYKKQFIEATEINPTEVLSEIGVNNGSVQTDAQSLITWLYKNNLALRDLPLAKTKEFKELVDNFEQIIKLTKTNEKILEELT